MNYDKDGHQEPEVGMKSARSGEQAGVIGIKKHALFAKIAMKLGWKANPNKTENSAHPVCT